MIDELSILKKHLLMMNVMKADFLDYITTDSIPELDKFKNYESYFPHKNCKMVLQWIRDSKDDIQLKQNNKKKKY